MFSYEIKHNSKFYLVLIAVISLVCIYLLWDRFSIDIWIRSSNPEKVGKAIEKIQKRKLTSKIPDLIPILRDSRSLPFSGINIIGIGKGPSLSYLSEQALKSMKKESKEYLLRQWNSQSSLTSDQRLNVATGIALLIPYSEAKRIYMQFQFDSDFRIRELGAKYALESIERDPKDRSIDPEAVQFTIRNLSFEANPVVINQMLHQLYYVQLFDRDLPKDLVPKIIQFVDNENTKSRSVDLLTLLTYNRCLNECDPNSQRIDSLHFLTTERRFWERWWEENKDKEKIEWFRLGLQREIEYLNNGQFPSPYRLQNWLTSIDGTRYGSSEETQILKWDKWWDQNSKLDDVSLLSALLKEPYYPDERSHVIRVIGSFGDRRFLNLLCNEFDRAEHIYKTTKNSPHTAHKSQVQNEIAISTKRAIRQAVFRITEGEILNSGSDADWQKNFQAYLRKIE